MAREARRSACRLEAARAACLGIVVNFILCAGLAKVMVGGAGWLAPDTMREYLTIYGASTSRPPVSKRLNAWLRARSWACAGIGAATVALECVLIPSTLLLPPPARWLGALALVLMHVGIALVMSLEVGIVFLTTLPSYLVGFGCVGAAKQTDFLAALSLGADELPALVAVKGGKRPRVARMAAAVAEELAPLAAFVDGLIGGGTSFKRLSELPALEPPYLLDGDGEGSTEKDEM